MVCAGEKLLGPIGGAQTVLGWRWEARPLGHLHECASSTYPGLCFSSRISVGIKITIPLLLLSMFFAEL